MERLVLSMFIAVAAAAMVLVVHAQNGNGRESDSRRQRGHAPVEQFNCPLPLPFLPPIDPCAGHKPDNVCEVISQDGRKKLVPCPGELRR